MKRKARKWKMWAIIGVYGPYTGTSFTRRDAVASHCADLGKTWEYCRRKGDRPNRIEIRKLKPRNRRRKWASK